MATILVVDDRYANREYLTTLLSYVGHRLLEASDGVEALQLARAEHPDLTITDLLMPRMDGYEFARQLRADPEVGQIPVVFYTASYLVDEAASLARHCGVTHIIQKPADPESLLKVVAEALGN